MRVIIPTIDQANVLLDSAAKCSGFRPDRLFAAAALTLVLQATVARGDPVINPHPRLLLTTAEKSRLTAKMNASDVSWQALKARADTLATYSINPYKFATSSA